MLSELKNTPNTMVGFEAHGEILKEDFDKTILPAIAELIKRSDKLNYLLIIDHLVDIPTFSIWLKQAMQTMNTDDKWNRSALIATEDGYEMFAKIFAGNGYGEVKRFDKSEVKEAIDWAAEQDGLQRKSVLQEEGTKED